MRSSYASSFRLADGDCARPTMRINRQAGAGGAGYRERPGRAGGRTACI